MLIQHFHQHVCIEKLLRRFGCKHLFYYIIILLFPQPNSDRNRKAQLFLFCCLTPYYFICCRPQGHLSPRCAHFIIQRQGLGQFQHLPVQKRHSDFQRISHSHLIAPHQDIVHKPQMQIHILHLRYRVFSLYPFVKRAGYLLNPRLTSFLEQAAGFSLRKNIRSICKITLLQCLAVPHQESSPLHSSWQTALRKLTKHSSDAHGNLIKCGMLQRFTIYVIASEKLVRAFSRKYYFYLLGSLFTQKIQGDSSRISHRFIHIILDIR